MVEVKVNVVGPFVTINTEIQENKTFIGLNHTEGKRGCLIYTDPYQVHNIAIAIAQITLPRPTIADIFKYLMKKVEFKIEKVVITELKESTYYAVIHLVRNDEKIELDARPTDAIIIALKSNAEIFINEQLLSEEGFIDLQCVQNINQPGQFPTKEENIAEWFRNLDPNKIPKQ